MQSENAAPARAKVGRRKFLIDRAFQLKYTVIMVVVGAAISLLFGAMMYQAHVEATQMMDLPDRFREAVADRDSALLWLVMAIAVVMAVALGLFGVLVTHRVAGPIYVFSHYVRVLGEGRFPKLRPLRKNDELKGFYEVLHEAVLTMREREKADGEQLKELAAAIEAAAKSPELAEALKPTVEKLRAMSEKMLEAAATEEPATPGQKAEAQSASAQAA
ncbi:MAG TPA: hypothetical protein DFS52_27300 [Myxococcales bacterium]|jgi:hypothetical protein|nr:hypothetical protein [Myxococcales bacterium]